MRLTLRTMLACLDADDRLDPADVEDLSQKIQQSKYATDLAARVRRLVQHARVGTPRLDAKGNGLDANSVAEYLDNTLPHGQIADFERNCIESDVRLAEVAACHQVLVLVLEQPAEVEPAVRERMYQLGKESVRQVSEDAPISETRTVAGGNVRIDRPAAATAPEEKPVPEVPEYLRASRRASLWPLAAAAVLAFLAVGIGLRLMGPLDSSHPMAQMLTGGTPTPPPPPTDPGLKPTDPDAIVPLVPVTPPDNTKKKLPNDVVDPRPMPQPPITAIDPPVPPEDDVPAVVPETRDPPALPVEPVEPMPPVKDPLEPPVPQPQVPAAEVGRFVSEDQVLARRDEDDHYSRVPSRASIFVGDELVVFPAYRPQLLLANNVQLTMCGESRVRMGMTDANNVSSIEIMNGRLLAASVGKSNATLAIHAGTLEGIATFADVDSEVAIEVRQYLPPGMNPATPGSTVNVVRLYTTRGKVTWREGLPDQEGKSFVVEAGNVRNYVGAHPGETVPLVALPEWVDGKNILDIDRRAAREVETKLQADRPLELALQEMAAAGERRAEVRALAVRALGCLNQFEPFLAAISDDTQRSYWSVEFDVVRDAIARSVDTATYVHDVFVKVRGEEDGENLYRMLWGFSPDDLKNGLAEELIKSLDVEILDYRVLAFENLRRITGSTQLYQPQFNAQRRRTPIAEWGKRLKAGEIVYKTPPAPIMDPKPAAGPTRGTEAPLAP
jgi:hypothetical protein